MTEQNRNDTSYTLRPRPMPVSNDVGDNLTVPPREIRVGSVAGGTTLILVMQDGYEITYEGVYAGEVFPDAAVRVKATGTTVSNIVGRW